MHNARHPWTLLLAFCVSFIFTGPVRAAFPDKPVRIVVPFAPGGGNDLLARTIAPKLSELFGQPVIVDNKPSAAGNIGAADVARSAPDGYTLLMATNQVVINPNLYSNIGFDVMKDLSPVGILANVQLVLVAHPSVPAASLPELIALDKKSERHLNYATPGAGTIQHLGAVLFNNLTGASLVHVPYRGTGPAIADVVGGQVQLAFATLPAVKPFIDTGKLRAFGVTGSARSRLLPNLSTLDELGVKGYEASSWYGILVPANTPPAVVGALANALSKVIDDKDIRARLLSDGFEPGLRGPAEMEQAMKIDSSRWGRLVKQANVKVD